MGSAPQTNGAVFKKAQSQVIGGGHQSFSIHILFLLSVLQLQQSGSTIIISWKKLYLKWEMVAVETDKLN